MHVNGDVNKKFAVVVKCGHVGNGYYLPIIFTTHCKDAKAAVEIVRTMPRVKVEKKDCILSVFEVSELESMFIDAINDRDPYLRGLPNENDSKIQRRRVICNSKAKFLFNEYSSLDKEELKSIIKTADMYDNSQILQKAFAPMIEGKNLVYSNNINTKELKDEYITQETIKQIRLGNVVFVALYYQIYGKNNSLGIVFKNNKFYFTNKQGKVYELEVPEIYLKKMEENGAFEESEGVVQMEENLNVNIPSAIDKFNRRMKKYKEKTGEIEQNQPGV